MELKEDQINPKPSGLDTIQETLSGCSLRFFLLRISKLQKGDNWVKE